MVFPNGTLGTTLGTHHPPQVVREASFKLWWLLVFVDVVIGIARFVVGDFFGGFISLWTGYWAWYMTREGCRRMTQQCLLLFGIICFLEFMIDLVNLLGNVAGRDVELTQKAPELSSGSTDAFAVTIARFNFIDLRQGFMYNMQSVLMILIALVDMFGAYCSWYSYNRFPTSLFDDAGDEEDWPEALPNRHRVNDLIANVGGINPSRTDPRRIGAFEGTSRRLDSDHADREQDTV